MSTRIALQLNAGVGIATSAIAAAMMWLVLTRPAEVASAVANHDYGIFAAEVGREIVRWVHVLVQFL